MPPGHHTPGLDEDFFEQQDSQFRMRPYGGTTRPPAKLQVQGRATRKSDTDVAHTDKNSWWLRLDRFQSLISNMKSTIVKLTIGVNFNPNFEIPRGLPRDCFAVSGRNS